MGRLYNVYLTFLLYNVGFAVRRSTLLSHFSGNSICKNNVCRNKPGVRPYILQGFRVALIECQYQFQNRRWNCSELGNSVERIMQYDFRESAFALAINAAGVTYSVTRACSSGELSFCGCDPIEYQDEKKGTEELASKQMAGRFYEEGVCNENIDYGEAISSRIFANDKTNDARTELMQWNYRTGRQALRNLMKRNCKCYGYSGACTSRACWSVLPTTFKPVGTRLKQRFDSATKVTFANKGKGFHKVEKSMKDPTHQDLLYTTDSPTFCERNLKIGSLGTRGRYCNPESLGTDGCDLMCCGREYVTKRETKNTYCQCHFIWCCQVSCKPCSAERTVNVCL